MRRTPLLVAAGTAVLVGAGAVAVAVPGSVTTGRPTGGAAVAALRSATGSPSGTAAARPGRWRHLLRRAQHAQVATSGPRGTFLYDAIRGVVSAVSPTSLTVRAADSFNQTFVLSSSTTRVRIRPAQAAGTSTGKGRPGSLADIHAGDEVSAFGRSADKTGAVPTAQLVIVGVKR